MQIDEYLRSVAGSGEAGLLVVSTKSKNKGREKLLELGFKEVGDPSMLTSAGFVLINKKNQKFWYDIAVQYPHGQIQWTDSETKEIKSVKLSPTDSALVFLCDKASFSQSPDLRTASGAAFRFE